jgi:microcystin degradation protein MlrC
LEARTLVRLAAPGLYHEANTFTVQRLDAAALAAGVLHGWDVYRTNLHTDAAERAEEVTGLIIRAIRGEIRPSPQPPACVGGDQHGSATCWPSSRIQPPRAVCDQAGLAPKSRW